MVDGRARDEIDDQDTRLLCRVGEEESDPDLAETADAQRGSSPVPTAGAAA